MDSWGPSQPCTQRQRGRRKSTLPLLSHPYALLHHSSMPGQAPFLIPTMVRMGGGAKCGGDPSHAAFLLSQELHTRDFCPSLLIGWSMIGHVKQVLCITSTPKSTHRDCGLDLELGHLINLQLSNEHNKTKYCMCRVLT